ncbi:MAG: hypothetical protein DELT_01227 [Desulfovibrio sp.]
MPSVFTHPIPAVAVCVAFGSKIIPPRLAAASVLAAVLPDLDVVSFAFGVKYAEALGHRGLSHSIVLALGLAAFAFLIAPALKARRTTAFLAILFATLSHSVLDAMTTGGLGVAFFWPYDETRHFFSWRPIAVSPFSPKHFFSEWGYRVIMSELRYVWAPCAAFALAGLLARKIFFRRNVLALFLFFTLAPAHALASCWNDLAIEPLEILTWNTAQKLCGYKNMEHLWSANSIPKGTAAPSSLPQSQIPQEQREAARAFMRQNGVEALLVIQGGTIRLEEYAANMHAENRWTSFSMAKSFTGLLVGAAIADGAVKSLDDRISHYLPELAHGAYAAVTVRQVLTMTSGVAWNENYRDPASDVAKLADLADLGDKADENGQAFLAYMARLKRVAAPGKRFNYSTGESGLLGHLVRRATGKSLAAYMSEKIWSKLGMEHDAFWITDTAGIEISGCCFSATLRDYGRIGQFMLHGGRAGDTKVLPANWMAAATKASEPSRAQERPYGYQIWVRDGGAYQASGIFGQLIHVDPARDLVIVMLSAWENATGTGELHTARRAFIGAVQKAVDEKRVPGKGKKKSVKKR